MRTVPTSPPRGGEAERRALKIETEFEQSSRANAEVKAGLQAVVVAEPTITPKRLRE